MDFVGTVYKMLPATSGTSARGSWQRQDVVFDMQDGNFTRKICVTFFNRPDDVARLREGESYQVSVNIESREYNGRWYTDIRAWRLQPKQNEGAQPEVQSTHPVAPMQSAPSTQFNQPVQPTPQTQTTPPSADLPPMDSYKEEGTSGNNPDEMPF